ncbi:MAG TPA: hypothetical protein QF564_05320 [Pirellulaceae bacterium]|nr:hypothetical protein [Pirellulaceae bacterium]
MKISVFTVITGKYSVGDAAMELAQFGYKAIMESSGESTRTFTFVRTSWVSAP